MSDMLMIPYEPSVDDTRRMLNMLADEVGEYAGLPIPVEGIELVIHPSYRFADIFKKFSAQPSTDEPEVVIRNRWFSHRLRADCVVYTEAGRVTFGLLATNPIDYLLQTLGASQSWDLAAEAAAVAKLRTLVKAHTFHHYMLTGTFLETSRRSGITYVFRRLRPTLALSFRTGSARILCGLCLHPIGYHRDTWAGCLVPTDDVIAHLILMRGDENDFWRQANHHPAGTGAIGL
jgi:hypothetical protein